MGWDWNRLSFKLPSEVKMLIQATAFAMTSRGRDKLAWADSPQGSFSLKNAYRIAMGHKENADFSVGWIWKENTLPRIKTFLWMCAHNSIRVKVCLKRRCVVHENICLICQGGSETILHALRNCPQIKHVWNQLKIMSSNQAF